MKINTFIIWVLGMALFATSCKNDNTAPAGTESEFDVAETNYKNDPTPASGIAYISQISRSLGNPTAS